MTFREKLALEHPDCLGSEYDGGCSGCPHSYEYEQQRFHDWCKSHTCTECWDRKIPENEESSILDSGELTTFETGAVRSDFNADGTRKGRCDLLPLRVLARIWRAFDTSLQDRGIDKATVFDHIADFQDTGNAQHLVLALNSFTGYLDFPTAFLEVAKHYEAGAEKYGECNWQKGLPIKNYVSSMVRHYLKWLRGDTDEPHDRAFVWNVLCCIWECEFSPRATTGTEPDAPVMVLEHVTKARSVPVAYLCDRKACTVCDNPACHHANDISHAVNFESAGKGQPYIERDNSQMLLKNVAPGLYGMFGQLSLKGDDSAVYCVATGCPVITTGFEFCQKLSLDNVHHGVEGLILGTAPGGALFFYDGDVWLRTTANSNTENVYAVRLRDGKSAYISANTLVTSVEDFDFK